jgi:ribosomal protein L29
MKRNDITALHKLDTADLRKKLQEMQSQLAKVKLEKKVGKLANRRLVTTLSDDVARVQTILGQREQE